MAAALCFCRHGQTAHLVLFYDLRHQPRSLDVLDELAQVARGGGAAARPEIQVPQSPKYMMTCGLIDLRQGSARARPGRAMLYVVEATSGVVMAYVVPWSAAMHSSGQVFSAPLDLWAAAPFTSAIIRAEE
jgi:hypothetical protein